MEIEKYKREYCDECEGRHTCVDLTGDLIDEQVTICMEKNK